MKKTGIALLVSLFLVALIYVFSWVCTCGIIKLITLCFGLRFKWSVATGIWLIICLARGIFSVTIKNK